MVRGTSPFLSMVPEDRSRVGEVARSQVVFTIPFRRVQVLSLPLRVRKNSIAEVTHVQTDLGSSGPSRRVWSL